MREADAIIEASKFWRDFNDSRVKTNYNQLLEWSDKLTLDQKFDRIFKLLEPNESNEIFYNGLNFISASTIKNWNREYKEGVTDVNTL